MLAESLQPEAESLQPVHEVEPIVNKIRRACAAHKFAAVVRVKMQEMKELRTKDDTGAKSNEDAGRSEGAPRVVARIDLLSDCEAMHSSHDGRIDLLLKQPIAVDADDMHLWIRKVEIFQQNDTEDIHMKSQHYLSQQSPKEKVPFAPSNPHATQEWSRLKEKANDEDWCFWQKMLSIHAWKKMYVRKVAEIVNQQYTSDLDPWIQIGGYLDKLLNELCKLETEKERNVDVSHWTRNDVDKLKEFLENRYQAQCTLRYCARTHPWPVRGTLHPWQGRDGEKYSECVHCGGEGGKDGGLFSGETLLHIAIVQHNLESIEWLLSKGANLDDRALGIFFQNEYVPKFARSAGLQGIPSHSQIDNQILALFSRGRARERNQFFSECNYGEFPLSFASAVGDEHVCHLLIEKYTNRIMVMTGDIASASMSLISMDETRAQSQNKLHDNARSQRHKSYKGKRNSVSDGEVAWPSGSQESEYKSSYYDDEVLQEHHCTSECPGHCTNRDHWADKPAKKSEVADMSFVHMSLESWESEFQKRDSFEGPIRLDKEGTLTEIKGAPVNPRGRTGTSGRGILGKWGPNHASDPIVTRFHPETAKLQVVVIKREDTGDWALPGGFLKEDEAFSESLRRAFQAEAGNFDGDEAKMEMFKNFTSSLFENGKVVYQGYVDDPRNTDNAWVETTAMHFACNSQLGKLLLLNAGKGAVEVKWLDIDPKDDEYSNLYAGHKLWVDYVAESIAKAASQMTGEWNVTVTKQERADFSREMHEWMNANILEGGGGGGRDAASLYKSLLRSAFINRRDSNGNTALHLAVMKKQKSTVDFLIENSAEPSLMILNNDNLTPFTMAARIGDVSTLQHIISKGKTRTWAYGTVGMTITSLEQIDTYRMHPELPEHTHVDRVSALGRKLAFWKEMKEDEHLVKFEDQFDGLLTEHYKSQEQEEKKSQEQEERKPQETWKARFKSQVLIPDGNYPEELMLQTVGTTDEKKKTAFINYFERQKKSFIEVGIRIRPVRHLALKVNGETNSQKSPVHETTNKVAPIEDKIGPVADGEQLQLDTLHGTREPFQALLVGPQDTLVEKSIWYEPGSLALFLYLGTYTATEKDVWQLLEDTVGEEKLQSCCLITCNDDVRGYRKHSLLAARSPVAVSHERSNSSSQMRGRCAFVKFKDAKDGNKAIKSLHGKVTLKDGIRPLVVKWAIREQALEDGFWRQPHVALGQREYAHAHQHPKWKSALEVVVQVRKMRFGTFLEPEQDTSNNFDVCQHS